MTENPETADLYLRELMDSGWTAREPAWEQPSPLYLGDSCVP